MVWPSGQRDGLWPSEEICGGYDVREEAEGVWETNFAEVDSYSSNDPDAGLKK